MSFFHTNLMEAKSGIKYQLGRNKKKEKVSEGP